jgi:CheY-like chemotaxis protein
MESVGRLAGGAAHDFNNMLNVIVGYTELAMGKIATDDPIYEDLGEVLTAARRSADIISKLLAFARKQPISPEVIDMNETVETMLKMLRRMIGEDIDLVWKPGSGLWPVRMDPSQVDQILANLLVNARDAITGTGRIIIETDNVVLDDAYCAVHAEFVPGDYVMLVVSDEGCGMDSETLANIFEPFFTTKDVGKGTGLGLAMVYGIVKQNDGFINVYSEPGQGTIFRIYLPRHAGETDRRAASEVVENPRGNGEVVLVVEDEAANLRLTNKILVGLGYNVVAASSPAMALNLADEHEGRIDLLITDVIMPEMNGRDLAERLMLLHADLKVLFMSGYTAEIIARQGIPDKGVHFIQKPFSTKGLAMKVREALGARS